MPADGPVECWLVRRARSSAVPTRMALALSATLALGTIAAAPARAASTGGADAEAPAAAPVATPVAASGGVQVPLEVARPVVGELRVPSSSACCAPPRVSLRIEEAGVATVHVGVRIIAASARTPVIAVPLGWVRTGRTLAVSWPRSSRLAPGGYRVTVTARDHHDGKLLRSAREPGEAALTVLRAPAPAQAEAGVPSPAQTAADGAVFPVAGVHNFGGSENRFGAPRAGYLHQGQDVLTAEGTPVVAPLAGTILSTSYQASGAGYYAVEQTTISFDFFFAHCRAESLTVSAGEAVVPGQALCQAGQTGDATTPHLDFEIWVGGWHAAGSRPIDPLPYLEAWEGDGARG